MDKTEVIKSQGSNIYTTLLYLDRDELHKTEKPYKLSYDPGSDFPRTNTATSPYGPIFVRDIREITEMPRFDNCGFRSAILSSELAAEDFYESEKVKNIYYPELRKLLFQHFNPSRVEILEHRIRRRHPEFPVSTGQTYEWLQPTTIVHTDFTQRSALTASEEILKDEGPKYSRIQCVNVWKPLRGPITDWPLGVCDERSTDSENDYIATDIVRRDNFTENYQIFFNPDHNWYYLSLQEATEVMIFRQTDTKFPQLKGVPHTSFPNPISKSNEAPRESIETRVFLYYN